MQTIRESEPSKEAYISWLPFKEISIYPQSYFYSFGLVSFWDLA